MTSPTTRRWTTPATLRGLTAVRAVVASRARWPRGPRPSASCPTPRPGPARCWSTSSPRPSTAPTPCSGRASTRRRPVRPTCIGLECSGTVAALGEGVDGLGGRRRGVRAARRWRVRRARRRAGRPADAGARRRRPRRGRVPARGRLHGVVQRLHDRRPAAGRDASSSTAAPAASARWRSSSPPPVGAEVFTTAGSAEKRELCRSSSAPTSRSTTASEDFVEGARGDRRCGADVILDNMGAKYLARNVDRPRHRRAARGHRHAGRHQGRARPRRAAAQARVR